MRGGLIPRPTRASTCQRRRSCSATWPPSIVRRTRPRQQECYACTEHNYDWFANDLEEPYTTPADKPFSWQGRMRITGGRTNVWARQSYRLSDLDFKAASFDGHGDDWPIGYEDLAPYYDQVEDYVGISGQAEGVYELPDGRFLPPMPLTCPEMRLRERVKDRFGWTVTSGRAANLTRPHRGRAACHYCGPCERGCATRSYFNAAFTTVADAVATGRCTHIPHAMAYQVIMDTDRNRARGVRYIDRVTHDVREVFGRVVILCAQALESVRILFNSASRQHPNGLANSSGALGHYLQDHIWNGGGARGEFPDFPGTPTAARPLRPNGFYVIRFRNTRSGPRYAKFLRGYGIQGGWFDGVTFNWQAPGFGEAFKRGLREGVTTMNMGGMGECLPRWENFVEIDPGGMVGRVRHPRAADSHGLERERTRHDPRHGRGVRGDARGCRRQEHRALDGARSDAGHGHPRSGSGTHGAGSEDVGAERVPADARRAEPVRHGRRGVRLDRGSEPDAHHHGARVAVE